MLLNLKKEKVCVNKIVGQKLESIVVEGDIIVPDIKPDILNTISASGNICIYRREATERQNKDRWWCKCIYSLFTG